MSDSHIRDATDVCAFARQLDRVIAGRADHLVLSGDLLDRWRPRLLADVLDALEQRELLRPERVTIIHGNHDLTSSGAHPRSRRDLPRLLFRAWDPPPLLVARRRRFYAAIEERAPGVAAMAPFAKDLGDTSIAALDTIPITWKPLEIRNGRIQLHAGSGCVRAEQIDWLRKALPRGKPALLVLHHYPLAVAPYSWNDGRIEVLMEIPEHDRARLWAAARNAGVRLVLCGHVHRARLDWHDGIAVGLNGQSGAAWAGRALGWYQLDERTVRMDVERTA